jgi:GTP-binding protein
LTPQLGVVEKDDIQLTIADIPGLISGASEGKGLGDEFLRHVERTSVLLHLIDVNDEAPLESYQTIVDELKKWRQLSDKPRVVCVSKTDTVDDEKIKAIVDTLAENIDEDVLTMSAQAHNNVDKVLYELVAEVRGARERAEQVAAERTEKEAIQTEEVLYELSPKQKRQVWDVERRGDAYHISGEKIERFALKTDPNSIAGTRRLFDIINKMRINYDLQRQGYTPGDTVVIAGKHFKQ